ncbi:putative toxin-antitoxin system toxin component, PIN family [Niveispirillum sp. KHB5.9]|uniref:putative toxin-antitoxin system toxin component, PIN family n=1 Tax=Niveispirillum sp. KHB5.9 TaxID=3400269 RepID=UPI003A88E866
MDADPLLVLFDTNIVLSHVLWPRPGPIRDCFDIAGRPGVVMLYSDAMVRELAEVLMREKFDRYASRITRQNFLAAYLETGLRVVPPRTNRACRDPKDNHILEAAVTGHAHVIVTGDDDLLVLNPFEEIKVLSPAAFVALHAQQA